MVSACLSNAAAICVGKRAADEGSDFSVAKNETPAGATCDKVSAVDFFGESFGGEVCAPFLLSSGKVFAAALLPPATGKTAVMVGDNTSGLTVTTALCAYRQASPLRQAPRAKCGQGT